MKYSIYEIQQMLKNAVIDKLYKYNPLLYIKYYLFDLSNPRCLYQQSYSTRTNIVYPE